MNVAKIVMQLKAAQADHAIAIARAPSSEQTADFQLGRASGHWAGIETAISIINEVIREREERDDDL